MGAHIAVTVAIRVVAGLDLGLDGAARGVVATSNWGRGVATLWAPALETTPVDCEPWVTGPLG